MILDRKQVKCEFMNYVSDYDLSDVKVRLKVDHTYRVAQICDAISDSLSLDTVDKEIAWLSGMMHDIGRFEQLRRYHTFVDADSCNHAALSADILFKEGKIRLFTEDSDHDKLLEKVIRLHNVYQLPELTEREYLFATVLRDADKIDILRVNCQTPVEELYDLPREEFLNTEITDQIYQEVMSGQNVNRKHSRTGIDFMVGHIAFVFGLTYKESFRQIRKQGYLDQLMNIPVKKEEAKRRMNNIRRYVHKYIDKELEI